MFVPSNQSLDNFIQNYDATIIQKNYDATVNDHKIDMMANKIFSHMAYKLWHLKFFLRIFFAMSHTYDVINPHFKRGTQKQQKT